MKLLVLAAFWLLVAVCALWFVIAHKGRVPVDPGDMDRTPGDW